MLLFVDDNETELVEPHVFGEQRVRADDDIDLALGQFGLGLLRLLRTDEARKLRDAHRQTGVPFAEAAEMLPRQQCRRHDDRDLRAGERRDEGGSQRHLGLAEADIAANEAIHRLARGQIRQRLLDRAQLILGFGIGEARLEFGIEPLGRNERLARPQLPLGGNADQFAGDLADALLDARLA